MAAALPPLSRWALAPERTLDERFLLLLLAERCRLEKYREVPWNQRPQLAREDVISLALQRELELRPLDMPALRAWDVALLEEMAPVLRVFEPSYLLDGRRILGGEAVLRYFTGLEVLKLRGTSFRDVSFVEEMRGLRVLHLTSGVLEDLGPLGRCASLRELSLTLSGCRTPFDAPPLYWLDARALGALEGLQTLSFSPNAAVLAGLRFPRLHSAVLDGGGCVQPDCGHLPEMPALRHLSLNGVQSLRGIQRFPELRSLKIEGPLRDFGDLPLLTKLDCLEVKTEWGWPQRVEPVAALPELMWVRFEGEYPRNYWPLTGAPKLRELEVKGCKLADLDKEAVNAVLPPWDEVFGLPERRALGPARLVVIERGGDTRMLPRHQPEPHADWHAHPKRLHLEVCWMLRRMMRAVAGLMGEEGAVRVRYWPNETVTHHPWLGIDIETMAAAQRLPEVLEVMRQELGWSARRDWILNLCLRPRIRLDEMTDQQKRWLRQIEARGRWWDDEMDYKRREARRLHTMESQFKLREAEVEGETPDPEDFEPPEILREEAGGERHRVTAGAGQPDAEVEEDEEEDDYELKPFDEQEQNGPGDEDGDQVAIAPPPEPPQSFVEDPYAHPLADYYLAFFLMSEEGVFFHGGDNLATMIQLMRREPDEYHAAPPKEEEG